MNLSFAPFIPQSLLMAFTVLAVLLVGWSLFSGQRGAAIRALALAGLLLALANPVANFEDREAVKSIVALVVDKSPSQSLGDRAERSQATLQKLQATLGRFGAFETRIIEAGTDPDSQSPATDLFEALSSGIRDIPSSRLAGAVMITDGQVHDIPDSAAGIGLDIPVHGLITGDEDEYDRRIEIVRAPRFGIVGEKQDIIYRVEVDGPRKADTLPVTIRVNGQTSSIASVVPGVESIFTLDVPRGGNNIVELIVEDVPDEISANNNRAVARIEGIRENLRVLLVSGAPHSGERSWRNLLKSDASVDLVHFTILRPPEKQDGTPITELSLIAFPTRELFIEKIDQFDLIIFDRYQNRGVLPVLYYDYIAQYVENGGALLVASGPELASIESIAFTPLAPALPAIPTGGLENGGYYPRLTDAGRRHPVTRELPGGIQEPPNWGRWFRTVSVADIVGDTVMHGNNDAPLLVLNRHGEGRVAMLLSDHGWLWARGFEGGGPHVALYRRVAHWLMKEPSLEEEALNAETWGRTLRIERQTMADSVNPVELKLPSGILREVPLNAKSEGLFTAELTLDDFGLVEVSDGELNTLAHIGAVDAPEFRAAVSTTEPMAAIAKQTGGIVSRVNEDASNLPQILAVRSTQSDSGGRLALRSSSETVLLGVRSVPLFAGFLGLGLLILALGGTWFREGR